MRVVMYAKCPLGEVSLGELTRTDLHSTAQIPTARLIANVTNHEVNFIELGIVRLTQSIRESHI